MYLRPVWSEILFISILYGVKVLISLHFGRKIANGSQHFFNTCKRIQKYSI